MNNMISPEKLDEAMEYIDKLEKSQGADPNGGQKSTPELAETLSQVVKSIKEFGEKIEKSSKEFDEKVEKACSTIDAKMKKADDEIETEDDPENIEKAGKKDGEVKKSEDVNVLLKSMMGDLKKSFQDQFDELKGALEMPQRRSATSIQAMEKSFKGSALGEEGGEKPENQIKKSDAIRILMKGFEETGNPDLGNAVTILETGGQLSKSAQSYILGQLGGKKE